MMAKVDYRVTRNAEIFFALSVTFSDNYTFV